MLPKGHKSIAAASTFPCAQESVHHVFLTIPLPVSIDVVDESERLSLLADWVACYRHGP